VTAVKNDRIEITIVVKKEEEMNVMETMIGIVQNVTIQIFPSVLNAIDVVNPKDVAKEIEMTAEINVMNVVVIVKETNVKAIEDHKEVVVSGQETIGVWAIEEIPLHQLGLEIGIVPNVENQILLKGQNVSVVVDQNA